VKADFFIELHPVRTDRHVNELPWFHKDQFTDAMLRKQAAKGLRAVTEFRIVKQHINNAIRVHRIAGMSRRLREFQDNPKLTPDHLAIPIADVSAGARKLAKAASTLHAQLEDIDVQQYFGEKKMWDELDKLAKTIREKLRTLGWRLDA
jgi:hypothetical protein